MVFNPWIGKGRHFYGHAEAVPDVTILKSAIWLERKYGEAPSLKTAADHFSPLARAGAEKASRAQGAGVRPFTCHRL
jgi:hypothetical protein